MSNTQKLSIRLLRQEYTPEMAVGEDVQLRDWELMVGAQVAFDSNRGANPKWTEFLGLELTEEEKGRIYNQSSYCLVFVEVSDRWFVISYGQGHMKIKRDSFQPDFGLLVVLNAVDPDHIRSADTRIPDDNSLLRRMQISRGSDQSAFNFDIERDLVNGMAGKPEDPKLGVYVSGKDSLTLHRKMEATEIPDVCTRVHSYFQKKDYEKNFGWVGKIRIIPSDKEKQKFQELDAHLVEVFGKAIETGNMEGIHLAYPEIIDPDKHSSILYKGFGRKESYPDIDISNYITEFRKSKNTEFKPEHLKNHTVYQVDDDFNVCGLKWKLKDCVVFETELKGTRYVLSGGKWYEVDKKYANQLEKFFKGIKEFDYFPNAISGEYEKDYNSRVCDLGSNLLCLDRKLVTRDGSTRGIELCDILNSEGHLIHVKKKTESCVLSHLFNQGSHSAELLVLDSEFRNRARKKIEEVQVESGKSGYVDVIPEHDSQSIRSDLTIVYAVISNQEEPKLPFFSMVSFRHAARRISPLGYKLAFAWIKEDD